MVSFRRTITLLATCVLAACLAAPAAVLAQTPPEETYVLGDPSAGSDGDAQGQADEGQSGSEEDSGGVPAAAADSADEGGLPILLIILAGTALAGATIAIIRKRGHD